MNASSRENGYVINISKCKIHLQKFDSYQIAMNHKNRLVQVYGVSCDNVRIHKDNLISANELYDPSEDGLNIVGSGGRKVAVFPKILKSKNVKI